MPFVHGDQASVLTGTLPHLAAVTLAAGLGAWVRATGPGGATAPA